MGPVAFGPYSISASPGGPADFSSPPRTKTEMCYLGWESVLGLERLPTGYAGYPALASGGAGSRGRPVLGGHGDLPGGLVSSRFLLTGSFESPLSPFLDTQDTSVFAPGETEHEVMLHGSNDS